MEGTNHPNPFPSKFTSGWGPKRLEQSHAASEQTKPKYTPLQAKPHPSFFLICRFSRQTTITLQEDLVELTLAQKTPCSLHDIACVIYFVSICVIQLICKSSKVALSLLLAKGTSNSPIHQNLQICQVAWLQMLKGTFTNHGVSYHEVNVVPSEVFHHLRCDGLETLGLK